MTNGQLIAGWLILLLATGPVAAARPHHPYLLVAQRDNGVSLDEAVAQARRKNKKGKVLSAETVRVNGRKVHRIKVLTRDGRVKRTQVDAGNGQKNKRKH